MSTRQLDPLDTVLQRLNGTVAKVTKLREFLGDLETELNDIYQKCEDAIRARVPASAEEARTMKPGAENGGKRPENLRSKSERYRTGKPNDVSSMKSEPKDYSTTFFPIPGPSGGPLFPAGGLKTRSLNAASSSRFRTAAAQGQVQGGPGPVPEHRRAGTPPILVDYPSRPHTDPFPFPKDIDLSLVLPELKCEGQDWFILFNLSPKVKRVLDVNLVQTLVMDNYAVLCVEFSQDGKWLAKGDTSTAQIYDVKTGAKTCVLDHASKVFIWSLCFSPNSKYLATGARDSQIRVWDIAKEQIDHIFEGHQGIIYSLHFSSDGRFIVSGSNDETVRIWDVYDRTFKVLVIGDHYLLHTDSRILSVAISPDSKYVAVSNETKVVSIWELTTGVLVQKLRGHRSGVTCVAFTPDGKGLVSGSIDEILKYWDVSRLGIEPGAGTTVTYTSNNSSPCLMNFAGHGHSLHSTAVSHDGTWIVSGAKDGKVIFWDTRTGVAQCTLSGRKETIFQFTLNPMENLLATVSGRHVTIWSYGVLGRDNPCASS